MAANRPRPSNPFTRLGQNSSRRGQIDLYGTEPTHAQYHHCLSFHRQPQLLLPEELFTGHVNRSRTLLLLLPLVGNLLLLLILGLIIAILLALIVSFLTILLTLALIILLLLLSLPTIILLRLLPKTPILRLTSRSLPSNIPKDLGIFGLGTPLFPMTPLHVPI